MILVLAAGNYAFTAFNPGNLAITKAPLTVPVDNASRPYGDRSEPCFCGQLPAWVRVYAYGAGRIPTLIKDLRPVRQDVELCEYLDVAEGVKGRSARIYLFSRGQATSGPAGA